MRVGVVISFAPFPFISNINYIYSRCLKLTLAWLSLLLLRDIGGWLYTAHTHTHIQDDRKWRSWLYNINSTYTATAITITMHIWRTIGIVHVLYVTTVCIVLNGPHGCAPVMCFIISRLKLLSQQAGIFHWPCCEQSWVVSETNVAFQTG